MNSSGQKEPEKGIELFNIAKKLIQVQPESINLSGGDPLTEDCIFKLMEYLFYEGIILTLSTSGWDFNQQIAKKVIQLCRGGIQFSLDGSIARTHDHIRGKQGAFRRVLNSVRIIRKISADYNIELNLTVNHYNFHEIRDIIHLANHLKVNTLKVSTLYPLGRTTKHNDLFISKKKLELVLRDVIETNMIYDIQIYYRDPIWNLKRVVAQGEKNKLMAITEEGNILIAPYLPFFFGNIFSDSIKDIWDKKMKNFYSSDVFLNFLKKDVDEKRDGELIWI